MLQPFNSKTLSLLANVIASSGLNNPFILCQFDSDVIVRTNNNSRLTISIIIITESQPMSLSTNSGSPMPEATVILYHKKLKRKLQSVW
jgi:hypothetical protein